MALKGLNFSAAGFFTKSTFELSKLIRNNGGEFSAIGSIKTTHLLTTVDEVNAKSTKIMNAIKNKQYIVSESFLYACINSGHKVDEVPFFLAPEQPSGQKVFLHAKAAVAKTVEVEEEDVDSEVGEDNESAEEEEEEEEESEEEQKKPAKKKNC